ncbi:MAG: LamG domain-containing protein, partial [Candidatus Micrarchaeia archaeon]
MAIKKVKRGFLMTILVVVLFTLMIAELLVFSMLNISYNKIQQSALSASQSINYASTLKSTASSFAAASLSRALWVLTNYEYNSSLRKGNFVSNLSFYLGSLMINGTLPNVPQNSIAANVLASWMKNVTLSTYNASIMNNLKPTPLSAKISESRPIIYQNNPYNLSVYYVENVSLTTPSGTYNYSLPISASIPLNGTLDLFYAQQGLQREIKFSPISNLTSVIGNAYAIYGNSSQNAFIYGTVLHVPSGVTCTSLSSNLPSWAQSLPFNKSIILATPSAVYITNSTCTAANRFGGLVTYSINSLSSPPSIPWLVYSSSTNLLNIIPNGTRALLYGPGMEMLNIEGLRNAIQNGSYFTSPFLPSYIARSSANFAESSPNGIFTFENNNKQVGNFNGQNSYVSATSNIFRGSSFSVSMWIYPTVQNAGHFQLFIASGASCTTDDALLIGTNINTANSNYYMAFYGDDIQVSGNVFTPNKWYFITATWNNVTKLQTLYLNGVQVATRTSTGILNTNQNYIAIGSGTGTCWGGNNFNGQIANVQIYNTSLLPSMVQQLYQEGIAGLPISNAGLVGWWPLNGNANDYSGFGNNGLPTAVSYSSPLNYTRDSIYIVSTPKTYPMPGTLSCISGTNCKSALYISKLPLETSQNFDVAGFSGSGYIMQSNGFAFMNNAIQQATISIWVNPSSSNGDIVDELGQGSINSGWHDTWIDLVNGNVYIR